MALKKRSAVLVSGPEPNGLDQTLICIDSGNNGVPHLADKELAVLLNEWLPKTRPVRHTSLAHWIVAIVGLARGMQEKISSGQYDQQLRVGHPGHLTPTWMDITPGKGVLKCLTQGTWYSLPVRAPSWPEICHKAGPSRQD